MSIDRGGDIYEDDIVIIRQPKNPREPHVITINCPDKTGLCCDLCWILLHFGVSIVRGDASTDGNWCYVVFWVVGKRETRWGSMKKRLLEVCPSVSGIYGFQFGDVDKVKSNSQMLFLLKFWCSDRLGLLHDVTRVLCDLELRIRKVKVSTTPDGRVVDLFFVTDTRGLLHTTSRKEGISQKLHEVLGEAIMKCEIELTSSEIVQHLEVSPRLPSLLVQDIFELNLPHVPSKGSLPVPNSVNISMDNTLSPSHTLVQIQCQDHKGLLYDITRTLKDFNIQISYGRFFTSSKVKSEIDLFVMQPDGKKILDPCKQEALRFRLRSNILHPLNVTIVDRGSDLELLVANMVELSGKGRPLVFHDITLALKSLHIHIFLVEIGRHVVGDRECEVYRLLLSDGCELLKNKNTIERCVMKRLMGCVR